MKKAISNWGAAGKDSTKEFSKTLKEIEKCPTIAKATTKAISVFGAKAGPDLADAIKGGRFEFQKYIEALDSGKGTIESTYEQIIDEVDDTQLAMQNAKVAMHDVGEIAAKTIGPILLDLSKKFKGLMENFDKLSDKEKKQILNMIAITASIGPAVKILSVLGKSVGTGTKAIGTFSQAMAIMGKNSTDAFKNASTGTQSLANGLSFFTSVAGLSTIAIAATTAAIIYFATRQSEAQKQAKELAQEINNSKKEFDEYNSKMNETINGNTAQIDSTKTLKEELATLVETNGKVKKGYEGRVSYILNELNTALGTEYQMNGNVVQSYKDIQKEIDNTIEKKKAEAVLQGEQEKYTNWKKEENEATKELYKTTKQLNEVKEKYGMSLEELKSKAEGSYGKQKEYLENVINAYEQSVEKVKSGEEIKKQYETDYALFVEGKYDEMGKTIINTTSNWTKGTLDNLREGIQNQENELENWKTVYETTGGDIAKVQKEQAEKNLRELAQNLSDRTSTVKELGSDEYNAWKTLAEGNYRIYSEQLEKMEPSLRTKIENLTGYLQGDTSVPDSMEIMVKRTTSKFEENMKVLTTDTQKELKNVEKEFSENTGVTFSAKELSEKTGKAISESQETEKAGKILAEKTERGFNTNLDGYKYGADFAQNISGGMTNQKSKLSITSAASKVGQWIAEFLHHTTPDKGPLKNDDEWMSDFIDNLANGILDNKSKVINSVERMSKEMESAFYIPSVQDFGKLQGSISREIANNANTINNKITLQIYPQHLTETELDRTFDYLNRKFGQYMS